MNKYRFSVNDKERVIIADCYKHAIEKACIYLESLDDNLDLIGLDSWEDVQEECSDYILSDLEELYEE